MLTSENVAEEMKKFVAYIDHSYPGLLQETCDSYSADYPHLNANWLSICSKLKSPRGRILLLASYPSDEVRTFAEALTRCGFSVRLVDEYQPCPECRTRAVPVESLHDAFAEHPQLSIPAKWKPECSECL